MLDPPDPELLMIPDGQVETELLQAARQGGGRGQTERTSKVLDLSHQLVGDLLVEEVRAVLLAAVLGVNVERPDQLQHLVHRAAMSFSAMTEVGFQTWRVLSVQLIPIQTLTSWT